MKKGDRKRKLPEGLYLPTYRDPKTGEMKESATIWCRYSRNGVKHRLSTETSIVREAVTFRDNCRGGKKPVTRATRATTFEDLAALVVENYEIKGFRSLKRIKQALAHLRGYFDIDLARTIGTDRLNGYVLYRRGERASNATINRELAALRRGFNLAAQCDPPKVEHVPYFEHLHEASARKGFFEREQLEAVLPHLPEYLRAPMTVAFITGWRTPSEVLTRQRKHLNLDAGVLRLEPNETKTGEPREFPINVIPELRGILKQQLEATRAYELANACVVDWLFHNRGGQIHSYYRAWHKACAAAGLAGKIPHDFRRSAARNLIRGGVPTETAMKLIGHKTAEVFRRYGIVNQSMLEDAAAKLAVILQADQQRPALNVTPLVRAK
jgi:integrase